MIARGPHDPGFVLHLDQDYGSVALVDLADVFQQSGEGRAVGLEGGGPVRRERIRRFSVCIHRLRKTGRVRLDPFGQIRGLVALPSAEPKHDSPQAVRSNVPDDPIECGEFELALFGLDQLPWDWKLDRVGVVRLEAGQHLGHFIRDEDAVVNLSSQDEKGLPIDQEGVLACVLDQLRNWFALCECARSGGSQDQRERGESQRQVNLPFF